MRSRYRALAILAAWIFWVPLLPPASTQSSKSNEKDQWPALSDEERKWTKPGLHAALLYREEHSDQVNSFSTHFFRIKILTDEGRDQGDIEIRYAPGIVELKNLQARTIQPDGNIIPFQGPVFDKTVARVRKVRLLSKSFSLPDVQAGSILEYRYRLEWKHGTTPNMRWIADHPLVTRRARFSVRAPSEPYRVLNWTTNLLTQEPRSDGENRVLEVEGLPPFHAEELMPPDQEVRPWLEFFYEYCQPGEQIEPVRADSKQMLDDSWTRFALETGKWVEKFSGKDRILRETVAAVTAPADPPETKLQKLYEHVQKLRNLTYRPPRDKAEGDKLEDDKDVEDVLRRGYANEDQINILFTALCRAAGFQSWVVLTADRDTTYFNPKRHRYSSLSETLALVQLEGRERFFDPGALFCPFGIISWEKTGLPGLRLVKKGGLWVEIPYPAGADTQIRKILRVQCVDAGGLAGELQLVFTGQEALSRRQEADEQDDFGRRKALEDEVRQLLPDGSSVKALTAGPWDQSEQPLEAQFHVRISGVVARTAQRMIVPLSVLRIGTLPPLYRPERIHPVDLHYANEEKDEVYLKLPEGYEVASFPVPRKIENEFVRFETTHQVVEGEIRFERRQTMSGLFFQGLQGTRLLEYFDTTRIADEDRTVLHVAKAR